jgi:hypothetical protein
VSPKTEFTVADMTAGGFGPYGKGAPTPEEIKVILPMDDWDELEFLAADDSEERTDLPSRVALAYQALHPGEPDEDVLCEGEEEGDVWVFYCQGLTVDQLLTVVREVIPEGWTAEAVAAEELASSAQITVSRLLTTAF